MIDNRGRSKWDQNWDIDIRRKRLFQIMNWSHIKWKSGGYIEGLSRQIPILLLLGSIVICEYFNNFILPILQLVSPLHLILNLFNQFLLVEVLNRVYIKRWIHRNFWIFADFLVGLSSWVTGFPSSIQSPL